MVLRITSSLRMQAVRITFGLLPRAARRPAKARMTGLTRRAVRAAMLQSAAHRDPSAADGAPSPELAAVAIEGSDADQGGDLLAVQLAQLRNVGQQAGAHLGAYPGTL